MTLSSFWQSSVLYCQTCHHIHSFRVLSRMLCLVCLNRTLVCSPPQVRTLKSNAGPGASERGELEHSDKVIRFWIDVTAGSESTMSCILGCRGFFFFCRRELQKDRAKGQSCRNATSSEDLHRRFKKKKHLIVSIIIIRKNIILTNEWNRSMRLF